MCANFKSAFTAASASVARPALGIVTWFSGGMSDALARKLTQWLRTKREEGMPVATFEDFGYSPDRETARSLGLTPVPPAVGTISIDSQHAMIGFEAQPRPTRST